VPVSKCISYVKMLLTTNCRY